ncbi:putative MFS family arabinose efflux permease [Azospirillum baldaniorum]|uniref:MFS transporter n=1 Tax=Azospirillum baldaniorum TaxID=1064539 RepID=UPI00119FA240|nr:MFS transporter [Azospirillum baldaniorum]TWA66311.1 putative MFS family arabinose efflux permease [Azospirillum baldaniorum]
MDSVPNAARTAEWRVIAPMLVIVLFVMCGMGMVIPVLSLYAQSFGVGPALIGLIITVFGVARLFVNLPAGILADRYGRRALLWGGPLVLGGASIAAALAEDFAVLLVWRFVQGVGSGLYMTGAMVAIADLGDSRSRGRRMGAYQTALLTGASIGPLMGGLLAERWGYTAPFWGFAAVSGLAALFAFLALPETRRPANANAGADTRPPERGGVRDLLRQRGYAPVLLVTFGVFFTRTAAQWQLIPLVAAHRFGMAPDAIGLALTLSAGVTLVTTPLAGWLADRVPRRGLIVASAASVAVALGLIAACPTVPLFWGALALLGLALGLGGPASSAFAAGCAPDGRLGPTLGLLRTAGDVGFVAGPLVAGFAVAVSDTAFGGGEAAGLFVNAALMAIAAAAFAAGTHRLSPLPKETTA